MDSKAHYSIVPRNELEDMQAEYERKLTAAERAAQLAVAHLKAQVRDATSRQGKAAGIAGDLRGRYQEIDPHRVARGITHRIHLTQEDCKKLRNRWIDFSIESRIDSQTTKSPRSVIASRAS